MFSPAVAFICALVFSFGFAILLLIINRILNLGTSRFLSKYRTYECGFLNSNVTSHRALKVSYFFVGILFLLFDIELLFLIPWLLHFSALGLTGVYVGLIFLVILFIGYVYEFKYGFINWVVMPDKRKL